MHLLSIGLRRCQKRAHGTGWRIAAVSVVASAVLLVALATDAAAALWVRITLDPASPQVGKATRVSVLTFYLTQELCADDPGATAVPYAVQGMAFGEFIIEAYGPGTPPERVLVYLSRRASDPTYWDGSVTFPSPGQWTLRMVHPSWSEPYTECAGAKKVVTVLPSAPPQAGVGWPGLDPLVIILSAVTAAAGVMIIVAQAGRGRAWR
jgi:hypothetical protein